MASGTHERAVSAPVKPEADRARRLRWFFNAGLAGYGLRLLLIFVSDGSNDIFTWARFGRSVLDRGLETTYLVVPLFNHPPLMGLWAAAALWVSQALDCRFSIIFKLPGLGAEVLIGCILWSAFRRRGAPDDGRRAFAAYGLSLCSILISGFHGNTDPLHWMLALLAVYCLESRRAPFLAGLALGAALNVKLIPMLLVVPFATLLRSWKEFRRAVAGGLLCTFPYAIMSLTFSTEAMSEFHRKVFGYKSYVEYWGVELFVRIGHAATRRIAPGVAALIRGAGSGYWRHGALLVLLAVAGLSLWQWRKRGPRMDGYQLGAATFSIFLLFGSGFGVQYMGSVVPWLLMVSISAGLRFSTLAGVFIGLLYVHFLRVYFPAASQHSSYPVEFAPLAFITWLFLCKLWVSLVRGRLDSTTKTRAHSTVSGAKPSRL